MGTGNGNVEWRTRNGERAIATWNGELERVIGM